MIAAKCFYHNLLIYPDGRIYDIRRDHFLPDYNGTSSIRGRAVYFYDGEKGHYLSRMTLVYEHFIKKAKTTRGELLAPIDGDLENCHVSNITGRKRSRKEAAEPRNPKHVVGWNGDAEIYL